MNQEQGLGQIQLSLIDLAKELSLSFFQKTRVIMSPNERILEQNIDT